MDKFGDLELAKIIERVSAEDDRAYVMAMKKIYQNSDWDNFIFDNGVACYVGNSPYTGVHGFGTLEDVHKMDLLEEIEHFYEKKNCGPIISVPSVVDSKVFKLLFDKKYGSLGCRNTYIYNSHHQKKEKVDFLIREVSGEEELKIWLKVVSEGFAGEELEKPDDISLGQSIKEGNHFFLAYLGEVPVAASALYIKEKVARLGGMGTLAAFRGRGIQTAMINDRIEYAQERGCDLIFSDTQPGNNSQRNLERNGFKLAYTRIIFRKLNW